MEDPVRTARDAAERADVEIRPMATLDEAGEVVRLQRETWGDAQTVPREMIRALQGAGVPPLGAFRGDRVVGFVLGFVGAGDDGVHLHSHMLAVEPSGQNAGVGRALKLAQRAWALEQGLEAIRWTFDPMIARNAHFNMNVLGAYADRFHRHYYGDMGDRINAGERTDRLEVVWRLTRGEVDEGGPPADRIEIPPDHVELRRSDPAAAAQWRDRVADRLEEAFARGLVVGGFDRAGSAYLLARGSNS